MTEEGKFSRAIAKSAGAVSPVPHPAAPVSAPTPTRSLVVESPAAQAAARAPAFQRVTDHWGPPMPSVMLFHDRIGQFASQMRSLRANIVALNNGAEKRVITVTSADRGEGKTTVCANLATALGEVESGRVIIVDGDILQPSLHLTMNVRDVQAGLRAVLQDDGLKLDDRVYETAMPNVDILPSFGIGPETAFEGPLNRHCEELLALLRKHYAYVIIDTPPVLAGSPAATFAKHSDGVILVARLEKTPREVIKRTAHDLEKAGATLIGCVLTHHKHHVPDWIYKYLGTTPAHYYRYGREPRAKDAVVPQAKTVAVKQVNRSETE